MRRFFAVQTWVCLALAGCGTEPGDGEGSSGEPEDTGSGAPTTGGDDGASAEDGGASTEGGTSTGGEASTGGAVTGDDDGDSSTGGAASKCKRGIAYGYHSPEDLTALSAGVSWWYNWAAQPDEGVKDQYGQIGVEYVPMIWGGGSLEQTPDIPEGARYLLAFNEPNFYSQANLTPQQAAELWPQVEAIADAHGLEIVSPALNYCGGGCNKTTPFEWFDEFFAACPGCRVDHLAVHWYACSKDALSGYIEQMKQYDRKIWLTEFSCLDQADVSVPVQKQYMQEALAYLEAEPAVSRYAWFSGRFEAAPSINLLAGSGELTEIGQLYVSAPASCE